MPACNMTTISVYNNYNGIWYTLILEVMENNVFYCKTIMSVIYKLVIIISIEF